MSQHQESDASDMEEGVVEAIVAHRISPVNVCTIGHLPQGQLEYRVKWQSDMEDDFTWEPAMYALEADGLVYRYWTCFQGMTHRDAQKQVEALHQLSRESALPVYTMDYQPSDLFKEESQSEYSKPEGEHDGFTRDTSDPLGTLQVKSEEFRTQSRSHLPTEETIQSSESFVQQEHSTHSPYTTSTLTSPSRQPSIQAEWQSETMSEPMMSTPAQRSTFSTPEQAPFAAQTSDPTRAHIYPPKASLYLSPPILNAQFYREKYNTPDWDPIVQSVTKVRRMHDMLFATVLFRDGTSATFPTSMTNQRCPQRMVEFYEKRIRFIPSSRKS